MQSCILLALTIYITIYCIILAAYTEYLKHKMAAPGKSLHMEISQ